MNGTRWNALSAGTKTAISAQRNNLRLEHPGRNERQRLHGSLCVGGRRSLEQQARPRDIVASPCRTDKAIGIEMAHALGFCLQLRRERFIGKGLDPAPAYRKKLHAAAFDDFHVFAAGGGVGTPQR